MDVNVFFGKDLLIKKDSFYRKETEKEADFDSFSLH